MEDKAEKQSWLGIENGTKFPLWAAWKTFGKKNSYKKGNFWKTFQNPPTYLNCKLQLNSFPYKWRVSLIVHKN